MKRIIPGNVVCKCECHTDPEIRHAVPCCFVCPKCKENIAAHIYNEHVGSCSRSNMLAERAKQKEVEKVQKEEEVVLPIPPPKRKPRKFPNVVGSSRTRYRKR